MSGEQIISERPVRETAQPGDRRHRLSGTHLTIIAVAALLTMVPSAAVAVTTTYTAIVDAKTGANAQVSGGGQLDTRGTVSTSDVVPTSSWSRKVIISHSGGFDIGLHRFVAAAPAGQGLSVGSISVWTQHPDWPLIGLYTIYVAANVACSTDAFAQLTWVGAAARQADRAMDFSFPIPFTVEPRANQRACLYVLVNGVSDSVQVSVVGAQGPQS